MGVTPGLLGPSLRSLPAWGVLPPNVQSELSQCPCQCGTSDGVHLLRECTRTDDVRDKCRVALEAACVLPADVAALAPLSIRQREEYGLMGQKLFSTEVEKQVRYEVASLWAAETERLRPVLLEDLDVAKRKMHQHLEPRPFRSDPSEAF